MGIISTSAIDTALATFSSYTWLSLHTGYSATGGNEAAGVDRQQATFDPPTDGLIFMSSNPLLTVIFPAPPAVTIGWIGAWDDPVAGNFLGMAPNLSSLPLMFWMDDSGLAHSFRHGLNSTMQVVMWTGSFVSPLGLSEGFAYWVLYDTDDTFYLSNTEGGPPIVPSSVGQGFFQRIGYQFLDGITDFQVFVFTIDGRDI